MPVLMKEFHDLEEIELDKERKNNIEKLFGDIDIDTITIWRTNDGTLENNAVAVNLGNGKTDIFIGSNMLDNRKEIAIIHEMIHMTQEDFYGEEKEYQRFNLPSLISEIKVFLKTIKYTFIFEKTLLPRALFEALYGILSYGFYYIIF